MQLDCSFFLLECISQYNARETLSRKWRNQFSVMWWNRSDPFTKFVPTNMHVASGRFSCNSSFGFLKIRMDERPLQLCEGHLMSLFI